MFINIYKPYYNMLALIIFIGLILASLLAFKLFSNKNVFNKYVYIDVSLPSIYCVFYHK